MKKKLNLIIILSIFLNIFSFNNVKAEEAFYLYDLIKNQAVLDNIKSEYVEGETGIDFSKISSETNGKGVYILSSSKDDQNPIYYYRGDIQNNNIIFADFCWKIVRTTETGGIKLIYNGIAENNTCPHQKGIETRIGASSFNEKSVTNANVGYMYGNLLGATYEEEMENVNSSTIKKYIDEWYEKNLKGTIYEKSIEDTIFCNDRSFASNNTGDGIAYNSTEYAINDRLINNIQPSYFCKNINDRFTVSDELGNGDLTYPIALLTADEHVFAGNVYSEGNKDYFLATDVTQWTMTPFHCHYNSRNIAIENPEDKQNSLLGQFVAWGYGVRPSISLKQADYIVTGDGTKEKPFIIDNAYNLIYNLENTPLSKQNIKNKMYTEGSNIIIDDIKIDSIIDGYKLIGWQSNDVTIDKNEFIMPNHDVTVTPILEKVEVNNPNTLDNIFIFQIIFIISSSILVINRKKLRRS